jgi:hypothetical protein
MSHHSYTSSWFPASQSLLWLSITHLRNRSITLSWNNSAHCVIQFVSDRSGVFLRVLRLSSTNKTERHDNLLVFCGVFCGPFFVVVSSFCHCIVLPSSIYDFCSFCWYWWNCWLSLFKLFNPWKPVGELMPSRKGKQFLLH